MQSDDEKYYIFQLSDNRELLYFNPYRPSIIFFNNFIELDRLL